ncbi:MAG: hypothetical protein ACE5JQ_00445 [Candidatus Methylomirabilales bacterium]
MRRFSHRVIAVAGLLFALLPVLAHAKIPLPATVPNNIPDPQRHMLIQRRAALFQQRDALKAEVEAHNRKCRSVPADSPLAAECIRAQKVLQSAVNRYAADVRKFNSAVVQAGASIPLHSDPEIPEIDRILRGVQRIRVPPPIPPEDVAIGIGQLAPNDETTKRVIFGLESGVAVLDIVGKFAGRAVLPAKVIIATGKTFIAAENAADVYLVKQNEVYEQALRYLKDETTRARFTAIVRSIKEQKSLPEDASIDMVRAARAILDPKLGNSGTRIAWDAMLSPEAQRAVVTQVCIELGGHVIGESFRKVVNRLRAAHQPAFIKATRSLAKARKALGRTKNPKAAAKWKIVIKQANEKIAKTYRTSYPEERIMGNIDPIFKHSEEEFREKKHH